MRRSNSNSESTPEETRKLRFAEGPENVTCGQISNNPEASNAPTGAGVRYN